MGKWCLYWKGPLPLNGWLGIRHIGKYYKNTFEITTAHQAIICMIYNTMTHIMNKIWMTGNKVSIIHISQTDKRHLGYNTLSGHINITMWKAALCRFQMHTSYHSLALRHRYLYRLKLATRAVFCVNIANMELFILYYWAILQNMAIV